MEPAASVVRAAFKTQISPSPTSLLIHAFSNGGSSSIANLYEQFAATAGPDHDKRLPPHATIFDSCPGIFRMPCAVAFISVGLPPIQQLIAAPFLYALLQPSGLLSCLWASYLIHWPSGTNLITTRVIQPRCDGCIFTVPTDALIDYRDVETHAAEARTKGFSVALEKYDHSAHVAHLRQDESRYWDIVKRAVEG